MMLQPRILNVGINCPAEQVYEFVFNPANLPLWASAFCKSVSRSAGGWIIETTSGPVTIRYAERNEFGVLDHYVYPEPDVEIYVPMRVVANGAGSEVIFILLRPLGTSDEKFAADAAMVEQDLKKLKSVLESSEAKSA